VAVNRQMPASPAVALPATPRAEEIAGRGTTGNERLTAATGASLLVLLAVIGVTLLQLRQLLSVLVERDRGRHRA
jgi:hypothetical protein